MHRQFSISSLSDWIEAGAFRAFCRDGLIEYNGEVYAWASFGLRGAINSPMRMDVNYHCPQCGAKSDRLLSV